MCVMTDKEILNNIERCIENDCDNCTWMEQTACKEYMLHDALALINRQQAEIDRLKEEHDKNFEKWEILDKRTKERYAELYEEAKGVVRAEAIKEFKCELIEQIEYIGDAHQAEYKDDFGKGWMAGFNTATHLITGAIGYIASFKNRGADNG